jgi:hypothetical protein
LGSVFHCPSATDSTEGVTHSFSLPGQGPTHTINRAELVAIRQALDWGAHVPNLAIATDSSCSLPVPPHYPPPNLHAGTQASPAAPWYTHSYSPPFYTRSLL